MKKRTIKRLIITISIILIILLLIGLGCDYRHRLHIIFIQPHFNRQVLITTLRQYGSLDIFLLLALMILMDAVPGCPSSVIGIVSGICLGRRLGCLVNLVGMIGGNMLSMLVIRHFGIAKSSSKHSRIIKAIMHMQHPLVGLVIGYAVPMIPTVFTNYAATKLHLKWHQLLSCMALGALPSAWLYACGGDAFLRGNNVIGTIALIAVVLLIFLVIIIHRDRKKHAQQQLSKQ
ncbi:MAG: VTT domain-containing protein [Candidatus Paralactobacillus gallistercoris]|uniref:VTT domain-containing protein n=1 Tax=Candidatus Paralactobacillus gallistercoris TaxID=2838724 RepID=A0A948TIW7_9LACO|nr:VTT domain-containing protein [Candidatus Paralactobacillus gallistercoris]